MFARNRTCRYIALTALAAVAASLSAQAERVVLPTGTVLPVRLDEPLSSRTSRRGDRFTAGVRPGGGDNGLPLGARVRGVVRDAIPARGDRPGILDLEFTRLVFPGGRSEPIDGSLIALDSRSVRVTRGGRLVATEDRARDRLKFVGAGAGAGLIIGSIAKHSAIESLLLGAAAGLLANELRRAPAGDVTLRRGAEFGVRLDRPVAFISDAFARRFEDGRWRDDRDNRGWSEEPRRDLFDRDREDREERRPIRYDPEEWRGDDAVRARPAVLERPTVVEERHYRVGDLTRISVVLDGREIDFRDAQPFERAGVPYVPLEPIARALGVDWRYDAGARMLLVRGGEVRIAEGSRTATMRGERRSTDRPLELRDGEVCLPPRLLAWVVGAETKWEPRTRTVVIETGMDTHQRDGR